MRKVAAFGLFAFAHASASNSSHYEKPPCRSDEVGVQVQGLKGETCAPKCSGMTCPTDVPAGATAKPQCVLQDSASGDKYCALTCFTGGCPTGSTCQRIGIVGICMYDSDSSNSPSSNAIMGGVAKEFEDFVHTFEKQYVSTSETERRFTAFAEHLRFIEEHNSQGLSYKLGVNAFADLTSEEFTQQYLGYIPPASRWGDLPYLGTHQVGNDTLPSSVDWSSKGAVTPVKNQAQCGSCWAFSTTGSLEGAWEIATGKLVSLSEQQLVDCAQSYGEQGCNGGEMDSAFKYVQQNGLDTEDSYSYKGRGGKCQASAGTVGIPKGAVTGFKDVPQSEQALMSAVAQQPVSIAIEADKMAFQLYRSGVLSGNCGTNLDHGVLAVGYGAEDGKDYWLVKNSWGSTWGEKGYVKMLRGKGGKGECGILSQPSYPVVSGKPGPAPGPAPPSPPPPSPSSRHYEKPPCRSDEQNVQVQGLTGATCSPKCDGMTCPTDVPEGTTARPQCVLQDQSTGDKYCALTCFLGGCPTGARCRHSGVVGLCMYDEAETKSALELKPIERGQSIINV